MFFDQVVPPCRPVLIVWYCGSNDIKGKKDAASILGRTGDWMNKVKQMDPATGILLVSVIRAPQKHRDGQVAVVDEVNRGYEEIARTTEGVFYVDVNPALQSLTGESRVDLYVKDGLHLNVEGYHQMTTFLKPAIEKVCLGKKTESMNWIAKLIGHRWAVCGLLFFATTINYIDRQILSLLKPILDDQLHWTNAEFGMVNSAF